MAELDRMIAEVHEWRVFHREQYRQGVRGAQIEAAACAIREKALRDAKAAICKSFPIVGQPDAQNSRFA